MLMSVRCFWLEPVGKARLTLRRYGGDGCPSNKGGYHNAEIALFDVERIKVPAVSGSREWAYQDGAPRTFEEVEARRVAGEPIPAWPTHCACGFAFETSGGQVFSDGLYRRTDTGEIRGLREWDHVPGAMWNAEWLADHPFYRGPDGRSIHVVCPDGRSWCIDGPASNCTKPEDSAHKCWVRHGEPPALTVDKNGLTCAAGAGSIQTPGNYHGFLQNGEFT